MRLRFADNFHVELVAAIVRNGVELNGKHPGTDFFAQVPTTRRTWSNAAGVTAEHQTCLTQIS